MEYLTNMQIVLNNTKKIFNPPPELKISEWADRHRRLSPENSAEAGQWNTTRAEYQREIMDVFNDPNIQRIVVMTSSQVGKTELVLNAIAYYMDQDPSPMLVVQPTLAMAQSFSKDRLAAMIRDSKKIKGLVAEAKSRDSGNTVLHKRFPGGHLSLVGSNSAAGLASRPIRVLLLDEVDRYELSAGSEGSPTDLAIARTKTFWNRKIYMCSTPTIKGISKIEAAFEESDKRFYMVPCPECNTKQRLLWKNVIWDENKPETAHYVCEECGSVIDESKKPWMLKHGEWQATETSVDTAGFHISELYSPWSTWASMAQNFLEAKKMPEMLKTFINTSLGESWEEQGDGAEYEGLLARRLNYDAQNIPESVLVLTCGADCQKDRIEVQVMGWGRNYEAWVIEYKIFWGDPNAVNVWGELDAYLKKRFLRQPLGQSSLQQGPQILFFPSGPTSDPAPLPNLESPDHIPRGSYQRVLLATQDPRQKRSDRLGWLHRTNKSDYKTVVRQAHAAPKTPILPPVLHLLKNRARHHKQYLGPALRHKLDRSLKWIKHPLRLLLGQKSAPTSYR